MHVHDAWDGQVNAGEWATLASLMSLLRAKSRRQESSAHRALDPGELHHPLAAKCSRAPSATQ
jgi:hypothetical protein